ncbi:MAG: hypothetical protein KGN02_01430 [bacterium]|nr:hypothetical protein [bacterium]
MTGTPRKHQPHHLSTEASSEIIRALDAHREANSLNDYDLAAIAGVSRDTVGRWRKEPVALQATTIGRMVAGVAEHLEAASATYLELMRLLTAAQQSLTASEKAPAERLRRRLNERGLRGTAVIAIIDELGFQINAKDDV